MTAINIDKDYIQVLSHAGAGAQSLSISTLQQDRIAQKVHEFIRSHQQILHPILPKSGQEQHLRLQFHKSGIVVLENPTKEEVLLGRFDTKALFQGLPHLNNAVITAPLRITTTKNHHQYPWNSNPAATSLPQPSPNNSPWLNQLLNHPTPAQPAPPQRPTRIAGVDHLMNISREEETNDALAIQNLRLQIDSQSNTLIRLQSKLEALNKEIASYSIIDDNVKNAKDVPPFTTLSLHSYAILVPKISKNIFFRNHYLSLIEQKDQLLEECEAIEETMADLQDQITRATTLPVARARLYELIKTIPPEELPTFNIIEEENEDRLEKARLIHQVQEEQSAIEDLEEKFADIRKKISFYKQPGKNILMKNPLIALWRSTRAVGNQLLYNNTYQNLLRQKREYKQKIKDLKSQQANTIHWRDLPSEVRILRHRIETVAQLLPPEEE